MVVSLSHDCFRLVDVLLLSEMELPVHLRAIEYTQSMFILALTCCSAISRCSSLDPVRNCRSLTRVVRRNDIVVSSQSAILRYGAMIRLWAMPYF